MGDDDDDGGEDVLAGAGLPDGFAVVEVVGNIDDRSVSGGADVADVTADEVMVVAGFAAVGIVGGDKNDEDAAVTDAAGDFAPLVVVGAAVTDALAGPFWTAPTAAAVGCVWATVSGAPVVVAVIVGVPTQYQ